MQTKYPKVKVRLAGNDGNAFAIIARVRRALEKGGASDQEIEQFSKEATSGNYDNVIQTAMKWVDVC